MSSKSTSKTYTSRNSSSRLKHESRVVSQTPIDAKLHVEFEQSERQFDYMNTSTSTSNIPSSTVSAYLQTRQRGSQIQPFGCIIAINDQTLNILAFSENAPEMLDLALHAVPNIKQQEALTFGTDIQTLFRSSSASALQKAAILRDVTSKRFGIGYRFRCCLFFQRQNVCSLRTTSADVCRRRCGPNVCSLRETSSRSQTLVHAFLEKRTRRCFDVCDLLKNKRSARSRRRKCLPARRHTCSKRAFGKNTNTTLEPVNLSDVPVTAVGALKSYKLAAKSISRLQSLQSGNISVKEVGELTGYDRVMVYKFHEDEHGEVISECRKNDLELESYLGLQYPATDIPQASRFLFIKNKVLMI